MKPSIYRQNEKCFKVLLIGTASLVLLGFALDLIERMSYKKYPHIYDKCVFCKEIVSHKDMDTNIKTCYECISKMEAEGLANYEIIKMARER